MSPFTPNLATGYPPPNGTVRMPSRTYPYRDDATVQKVTKCSYWFVLGDTRTAIPLPHRPMIPAQTPLLAVHLDAQDQIRAPAEQPPPLFDTPSAPKVSTHDEAEPSKLIFLLLLHIAFVKDAGLHVQLGDESVHPHGGGANDCRAVLFDPTDHADRVSRGIIQGSRILHGEVLIEHLSDDPMEHGFDVDSHGDSLARAIKHDCGGRTIGTSPVKIIQPYRRRTPVR